VGLGLQTLYSLLMVVFSGYFAFDAYLNRKIPLLAIGLGVCAIVGLIAFALRLKLLIQLSSENRLNDDR